MVEALLLNLHHGPTQMLSCLRGVYVCLALCLLMPRPPWSHQANSHLLGGRTVGKATYVPVAHRHLQP